MKSSCRTLTVALGAFASLAPSAWAQLDNGPATLDQSRGYEAELLSDAASRMSLLQDPATTGFAKNHFFISDGGNNTLNIDGYFQTRYIADFRSDQPSNADTTSGFQMRRTRLIFSGTVWDKHLFFLIQPEFSRSTGAFVLQDAFGKYTWDNGFYARWGQYKPPLLHEELVGDTYQLAVERSTVNLVFSTVRSQGAGVGYTSGQIRLMADLTDGGNALNTDFNSTVEADYAITGRAEWMFAGDSFSRFDDFTSWKDSPYAGLLGAAMHYQSGGDTGYTTDKQVWIGTLDCSVEGSGWNAFVEGVWRETTPAVGATTDDYGIVAQAGFFVSDQTELFARYDVVIPDVGDNFNTVTGGVNYYLSPNSHVAKFTADVMYCLDSTTGTPIVPQGNTGSGYLADSSGDQVSIRLQMQIMF